MKHSLILFSLMFAFANQAFAQKDHDDANARIEQRSGYVQKTQDYSKDDELTLTARFSTFLGWKLNITLDQYNKNQPNTKTITRFTQDTNNKNIWYAQEPFYNGQYIIKSVVDRSSRHITLTVYERSVSLRNLSVPNQPGEEEVSLFAIMSASMQY